MYDSMREKLNVARGNEQLGNYRIVRLLGKGGFADVYLGKHIYLNTKAAIKVLHTRPANEELRRFRLEAQYTAQMRHRNIVQVLDFGLERKRPFLIMAYAPNGALRQHFPTGMQLSLGTILPYVVQIADALQYLHNRGLIHCDIKPENMLLGPRNEVWLSDFGIALATRHGNRQESQELRGTAAYMAPEQVFGNVVPASDQYSLAVMVYEWLCGQRPFSGTTLQVCYQQLYDAPPRLRQSVASISPAVERVVLKALAKEPAQRFAHVREFAYALKQVCQEEQPLVLARSSAHLYQHHHLRNTAEQESMARLYATELAVDSGR